MTPLLKESFSKNAYNKRRRTLSKYSQCPHPSLDFFDAVLTLLKQF